LHGRAEAIRLLLQHEADVNVTDDANWTALHWVPGDTNVAQILLDHGANINAITVTGKTPLFKASEEGRLELVRLLLARGADVHIRSRKGQTAFQVATSNNHTHIAQLLLEHGAEKE